MAAQTASRHALDSFAPEKQRQGLALCLSGGGFRAALFHLGALRRLNELGVLSGIDTVTAVSGGSILAAHLAAVLQPRFVFCSTDMEFGVNWEFRRDQLGDYQVGYAATPPDWPVARAVAASSAFPPVFNPFPVDLPPEAFKGGQQRMTDLRLTDGGVYDNLGLEPVWKSHATLLVSDGGAPFDFEPDRGLLRRLKRYADIIGGQVAALRKRWLVSNFIAGTLRGTYWGVATAVESYEQAGFPGYSRKLVEDRIASVRTDLDAFSPAEMDVLENHGYTLAAVAVARYAPELVRIDPPPPSAPPHRGSMNEAAVRKGLAESATRTLLGRW